MDPIVKNLDRPDQRPELPKGHAELVHMGDFVVVRGQLEPGWRWSNDWRPIFGPRAARFAEIALNAEGPEAAVDWCQKAIELARPVRRLRYDTLARVTLAEALLELRRPAEAVAELRTAVTGADRLEHPPTRWKARAALGRALYVGGEDEAAERAFAEAADVIRTFAASLSPRHSESLLASVPTREILEAL